MKDFKIPRLPRIDFQESKEISETFLRANKFLDDNSNFSKLPINSELLAIQSGHPIEILSDLRRNFDTKGTAFYNSNNKRFEIYIDSDHYMYEPKSSQFTIAEELGHIILHSFLFENISSPDERIEFDQYISDPLFRIIEKQAKSVASELLLPSILFDAFIDNWFEKKIQLIKDERPANENDLLNFIGFKIGDKLNLSDMIIKRAMLRRFDNNSTISFFVKKYDIKYIEDTPRNPMKSSTSKNM